MGGVCARLFGCGCLGENKENGGKGVTLEYDPDFKGPINGKQRWPTDILCLALFIVFVILLFAIGIYSWVEGNPDRLLNPVDSKGRLCGVDSAVKDKPYLLFFDLSDCINLVTISNLLDSNSSLFSCPTPQVCVESCPTNNEVGVRNNPVCVDSVDTNEFTDISNNLAAQAALAAEILDDRCAPYYLTSSELAGRCIPTIFDLDTVIDTVLDLDNTDNVNTSLSGVDFTLDTLTLEHIRNGSLAVALLLNGRQFLLDVYQDLAVVWPGLLIGTLGCLIVAFLYLVLLRFIAPFIIWGGIILAFLLLGGVVIASWVQFVAFENPDLIDQANNLSSAIDLDFIDELNSQLDWWEHQRETWLAIAIISTIFLIILLLALCCLRKRIQIAIALIRVASKAVGTIPSTLFYPIVTWCLLVILFTYWVVVAVFLVTASEAQYIVVFNDSFSASEESEITDMGLYNGTLTNNSECEITDFDENGTLSLTLSSGKGVLIQCIFEDFVTSNFLLGIQVYHLFGLFWVGNWILALGECVLAGAFATYYWTFDKKDIPWFVVFRSLLRTLFYHTGSLAFGALIIAIIQLIRFILGYVQRQLKKRKEARWAQIMLTIFQCCFWCLEKILRYINRQAYIEIAIYGYNFCVASCKVVGLLLRNIIRTVVKDNLVRFLLFIGELCIVGVVIGIAWLAFGGYSNYGEDIWGRQLNYYLVPIMVLAFVAYLVASGFTSVFLIAVDTVFICFLEDSERNNGTDKPYFMSDELKKILGVDNKITPKDVRASHDSNLQMMDV